MNSEKLELFPFGITSVRNPDNCHIISIEIYKEGRKMPLHERGKVVLYKSSLEKNIQASQCVCTKYVSRT